MRLGFIEAYRKARARARTEKGQISVMMGIMMLTFVFFFAFVVNTGMLVNAKINLQNAADLAAYSGAAVQARQLTNISYLNYEMRRQYKKFLFRYYVLGNMAQGYFQQIEHNSANAGSRTPMKWIPAPSKPNPNDYQIPTVCMIFLQNDNYCQVDSLPKITMPPTVGFDSISQVLRDTLNKIEDVRVTNCERVGDSNATVLRYWLWNTDPDLSSVANDPNAVKQGIAKVVLGLTRGIGLIPKEILLRKRIDTLTTDYVNDPAHRGVTFEQINGMINNAADRPTHERTIQAYLSAYYTLGEHTFSEMPVLDELQPDQLLALNDIKVKFKAYALKLVPTSTGCWPEALEDGVTGNGLPVGVYKDPSILTYYAIRLKAKARLMFSPFGELELMAYSAAQPFGSRIGPKLQDRDFLRNGTSNLTKSADSDGNGGDIPNLPLRDADDNPYNPGSGWDTQEAMSIFYQSLLQQDPKAPIDENAVARGYHAAMAPTKFETTRYNIPFDGEAGYRDPFVKNFDSNRIMAFWAPVFTNHEKASMDVTLQTLLMQYAPQGNATQANLLQDAKQQFLTYLAKLQQGVGEPYDLQPMANCGNCEGFNIVRIADSVNTRPVNNEPVTAVTAHNAFAIYDPSQIRTSWSDVYDSRYDKGRVGYSVKFVSFNYLRAPVTTDPAHGQNSTNVLVGDDQFDVDAAFIKH